MPRVVLGYVNGKAIWSEHTPGNPGSSKIGGQLVVGASEKDQTAARKRYPLVSETSDNVGVESTSPEVSPVSVAS